MLVLAHLGSYCVWRRSLGETRSARGEAVSEAGSACQGSVLGPICSLPHILPGEVQQIWVDPPYHAHRYLCGERVLVRHTAVVLQGANSDGGQTSHALHSQDKIDHQKKQKKKSKIVTQRAVTVSWKARNAAVLDTAAEFLWLFPCHAVWAEKQYRYNRLRWN